MELCRGETVSDGVLQNFFRPEGARHTSTCIAGLVKMFALLPFTSLAGGRMR